MITKLLIAISSLTVVMMRGGAMQPVSDEPKTTLQFCSNLKSYMRTFEIDDFFKSVNDRWQLLHPRNSSGQRTDNSSTLRTVYEETLIKFFEDCDIQTEMKTLVTRTRPGSSTRTPQEAGVLDLRTLDQTNANFVMKYRIFKPACGPLRQLLQIMEADGFHRMYPNERVTVLALSFNARYDAVIYEWIAFLYQKGEIIDAKQSSKCLYAKEFADLQFKEKPILKYFETTN